MREGAEARPIAAGSLRGVLSRLMLYRSVHSQGGACIDFYIRATPVHW